jgi:hypothetical protein
MQTLNREAGGMLEVVHYGPEGLRNLVEAGIGGNVAAAELAAFLGQGLMEIENKMNAGKPAACLYCAKPITKDETGRVVGFLPMSDQKSAGIVAMLCDDCVNTGISLEDKICQGIKGLWPDARPIDITPGVVGHA